MNQAVVVGPTLLSVDGLWAVSIYTPNLLRRPNTSRVVIVPLRFKSAEDCLALDDLELHALDLVVEEAVERHLEWLGDECTSVESSILCQSIESIGGNDGATGCFVDNVGVWMFDKVRRQGKLQEVREALGPWARTSCAWLAFIHMYPGTIHPICTL